MPPITNQTWPFGHEFDVVARLVDIAAGLMCMIFTTRALLLVALVPRLPVGFDDSVVIGIVEGGSGMSNIRGPIPVCVENGHRRRLISTPGIPTVGLFPAWPTYLAAPSPQF